MRLHYGFASEIPFRPRCSTIVHFTIVYLVTWPMYESEAEVDLVLISPLFEKSGCCEGIENVFGLRTSSFTVKSTNGQFSPIFGDKIGLDHGVTSGLV